MPTVRTCRLCDEPTKGKRVYCDACLSDPPVFAACPVCMKVFQAGYVDKTSIRVKKYCSKRCQAAGVSRRLHLLKADLAKLDEHKVCPSCGTEFAVFRRTKKGWRERQFCSNSCAQSYRVRSSQTRYTCEDCGTSAVIAGNCPSVRFCTECADKRSRTSQCSECRQWYSSRSKQPSRCPECHAAWRAAWRAARLTEVTCTDCGVVEVADPQRLRCDRCKNKRKHARASQRPRRHLKHRAYIIERDQGKCSACKCRVRVEGDPMHPRAAQIDHIIPRSLWPAGVPGMNDVANLRLMCRRCNAEKSNGTAPGGDQLMLVG